MTATWLWALLPTTRKCDGSCGAEDPHSHHLTWLGRWHYTDWRPWRGR